MPQVFTGDEILQIAMELEETGQVFYEALAVSCRSERVSALCRRLAGQERTHYNTFKRMREAWAGEGEPRAMDRLELEFVQGLINDRIVPGPAAARELAAEGGLARALDLAVRLEEDTVRFYTQIASAVDHDDAKVIRDIIAEEERHARELTDARNHIH